MAMPRPSPGHRRLEMLAGHWEGKERMYPSEWDPKGGMALGRTTGRLALGGFAVITDYEQERDGAISFSGHGVYTYDPDTELYSLFWLDSTGSPPEVFAGRFTGDVLTLSHGGPHMHDHSVHRRWTRADQAEGICGGSARIQRCRGRQKHPRLLI